MLNNIAEKFLKYGASVAIMSRNEVAIKEAAEKLKVSTGSQKCFATRCDIRKTDEIEAAVNQVLEKFGRIDVLINGAAGNFLAGLDNLSTNAFKTVHEIDTIGTFNMIKCVYTKWMKKNGGNIINISATLHYSGTVFQMHAGSAKAAVDALTKHLAAELGPKGIRINGIAPGPVAGTEGFDRLKDTKSNTKLEEFVPLQRFATLEDISSAALFLASDASSYITGQTLVVDGGQVLAFPNFTLTYDAIRTQWKSKL